MLRVVVVGYGAVGSAVVIRLAGGFGAQEIEVVVSS